MENKIRISGNRVEIGQRLTVSFQRTLRIPEDGKTYPLPPTLGMFPVKDASDYLDRLPEGWIQEDDLPAVLIPMYQREALWLAFEAEKREPCAVMIGIGNMNALTGQKLETSLKADPQDYIVCPIQPWLDGINTGPEEVRQFVAVPLGMGYSVEGQITGKEEIGGFQIFVFPPYPGALSSLPKTKETPEGLLMFQAEPDRMGIAPGGKISQKIYPDPYGISVWDSSHPARLSVFILNSLQYQSVTGEDPPPTPISAQTYTEYGFPWFALYDEGLGSLPESEILKNLKSLRQMAQENTLPDAETDLKIKPTQVKQIKRESP